jgi:putative aldouronate transport system permease protein
MLLPAVVFLLIFSIVPMGGLVMAFQRYEPLRGILGSKFVGLANFKLIVNFPEARRVITNTLIISISKILVGIAVPVSFALILNECSNRRFMRFVQTAVYLPNFLSWVIVAAMIKNIFGYAGIVNTLGKYLLNCEPIMFMASNTWFRPIVILSDTWKSFGFGAVVYISAITGIDPNLYEAASIDGAGRWKRMLNITVPGIVSTIIVMSTLSLGNVLNAGFDQVFNMYNPIVYSTGDILDTYIYRIGLEKLQYSIGTAVGLFKSAISFLLIAGSYWLAKRFAGYSIF